MLEGITRLTAIDIATTDLRLPVQERAVSASELRGAEEVFVTSTAGGIMPVTKIDGKAVGSGRPGPATSRIRKRYWALHDDPRYRTAVSYR